MANDDFNLIEWIRWIWSEASPLDTQEAAVMTSLARRSDAKGMCYPGIGTIGADTKVSRRKVILAVKSLEARGLIRKTQQRRGNGFDRNHYAINSTPPGSASSAPPKAHGSASRAPLPTVPSASDAPQVVHEVHLGSAQGTLEVTQEVTHSSNPTVGKPTTEVKKFYLEVFQDVRGMAPDWSSKDHAKYGKAFKDLSTAFDGNLETQKQVIDTAMRDEFSPCMDPFVIFKRRNDYVGRPPRRKLAIVKAAAPQRGLAHGVQVQTDLSDLGGGE